MKSLANLKQTAVKTMKSSSSSNNEELNQTNSKLTAEKLVEEQATVRINLDMATEIKEKATAYIHAQKEKWQTAIDEMMKLHAEQKKQFDLWKKFQYNYGVSYNQLTERCRLWDSQVRDVEQDRRCLWVLFLQAEMMTLIACRLCLALC